MVDYCLTCSDDFEDDYDPTRECFTIDIQETNDGHTTDDDDKDEADLEVARPPDPTDNPP